MGTSTDGILAYGYDLGGSGNEWLFAEVDGEYGPPTMPWFLEATEADDPDGERDYGGLFMDRLLAVHGFTETDWQVDGYWDRKQAAEEALGVELVFHCSGEYPMVILAAKSVTARRGSPKTIDPEWLADVHHANDRLAWALTALGVTPKATGPAWLLASNWG